MPWEKTKFAYQTPSWYVKPGDQIKRVHRLNRTHKLGFKMSDFPPQIPDFEPQTPTEILLLAFYLSEKCEVSAIQRTFNEHISVIKEQLEQQGYGKRYWDDLEEDSRFLRLAPGVEHEPGVFWVVFDYAANWRIKINNEYKVINLRRETNTVSSASSEVLSAFVQFPEWLPSMDDRITPYVNLPGYRFPVAGQTIAVRPWFTFDQQEVFINLPDDLNNYCASPVFERLEC